MNTSIGDHRVIAVVLAGDAETLVLDGMVVGPRNHCQSYFFGAVEDERIERPDTGDVVNT